MEVSGPPSGDRESAPVVCAVFVYEEPRGKFRCLGHEELVPDRLTQFLGQWDCLPMCVKCLEGYNMRDYSEQCHASLIVKLSYNSPLLVILEVTDVSLPVFRVKAVWMRNDCNEKFEVNTVEACTSMAPHEFSWFTLARNLVIEDSRGGLVYLESRLLLEALER